MFQIDVEQADNTDSISSTLEIKSNERNEEILSEYNEKNIPLLKKYRFVLFQNILLSI